MPFKDGEGPGSRVKKESRAKVANKGLMVVFSSSNQRTGNSWIDGGTWNHDRARYSISEIRDRRGSSWWGPHQPPQ